MSKRISNTYKANSPSKATSPSKQEQGKERERELSYRQVKKMLFDCVDKLEKYDDIVNEMELVNTLTLKMELMELDEDIDYRFVSSKVIEFEQSINEFKFKLNGLSKIVNHFNSIINHFNEQFISLYSTKGFNYTFRDKFSKNLNLNQYAELLLALSSNYNQSIHIIRYLISIITSYDTTINHSKAALSHLLCNNHLQSTNLNFIEFKSLLSYEFSNSSC